MASSIVRLVPLLLIFAQATSANAQDGRGFNPTDRSMVRVLSRARYAEAVGRPRQHAKAVRLVRYVLAVKGLSAGARRAAHPSNQRRPVSPPPNRNYPIHICSASGEQSLCVRSPLFFSRGICTSATSLGFGNASTINDAAAIALADCQASVASTRQTFDPDYWSTKKLCRVDRCS